MPNTVIPILHQLYLIATKIEIPENRMIPNSVNSSGKITKASLFERSREYYQFDCIAWDRTRIIDGVYLYHFHEILIAYTHNRLKSKQEHLIWNKKYSYGIKLYYGKNNIMDLTLEIWDQSTQCFTPVYTFSKVECCIIVRMLNFYFSRGEIAETLFLGDVKCHYGKESFMLKDPSK